jgi:hypothetical protein
MTLPSSLISPQNKKSRPAMKFILRQPGHLFLQNQKDPLLSVPSSQRV